MITKSQAIKIVSREHGRLTDAAIADEDAERVWDMIAEAHSDRDWATLAALALEMTRREYGDYHLQAYGAL